ncbi:MAG TPA: transcriptional regulator, partial [Mycobacterium sp.]|nr:transcriptional regulator [Mycobacterium sp.]
FQWGQRHLPGRRRLRLTHLDCGADASVEIRCSKGHPVPLDELGVEAVRRSRRDA